jgi:hypothetical protein
MDQAEQMFFLTGGVGLENTRPNPDDKWISVRMWDELCRMADLPVFKAANFLAVGRRGLRKLRGGDDGDDGIGSRSLTTRHPGRRLRASPRRGNIFTTAGPRIRRLCRSPGRASCRTFSACFCCASFDRTRQCPSAASLFSPSLAPSLRNRRLLICKRATTTVSPQPHLSLSSVQVGILVGGGRWWFG